MPLILVVLSVLVLFVLAGVLVTRFWASVTTLMARDEESTYGESLRGICLEV